MSRLSKIAVVLALLPGAASAGTLIVKSLGDGTAAACGNTCRLRDAIAAANAGDSIQFDPAITATNTPDSPPAIVLTAGQLVIDKNLTIQNLVDGQHALALDGNDTYRVLRITGSASAFVYGLTLRHGYSSGAAGAIGFGAAALVESGASLSLYFCNVRNNLSVGGDGDPGQAGAGFVGNPGSPGQAGYMALGGAIYVYSGGSLSVNKSAIFDNVAQGGKGGAGGNGGPNLNGQGGNGGRGGAGGAAKGGGVYAEGSASFSDTTLYRNYALGGAGGDAGAGGSGTGGAGSVGPGGAGGSAYGGGSYTGNADIFSSQIQNTTYAGHFAVAGGGGAGIPTGFNGTASGTSLYGGGSTANSVVLRHTLIADTLKAYGGVYLSGAQSPNLQAGGDCTNFTYSNVDPRLSPFAWNGGFSPSLLPRHDSPVLDAATYTCSPQDQRYINRPIDGDGDGIAVCDIGAVESDRIFDDGFQG